MAAASLSQEYGPGRSNSAMARSSCSSTAGRRPRNGRRSKRLARDWRAGPFAVFASVTERWLPTIVAPFDVRLNGIRSTVRVDSGKVYELALSRIKNPVTGDEEELYLDKPTGFTAKRSELGLSTVSRFKAPGLEYDNSGQYAEFSKFLYAGP